MRKARNRLTLQKVRSHFGSKLKGAAGWVAVARRLGFDGAGKKNAKRFIHTIIGLPEHRECSKPQKSSTPYAVSNDFLQSFEWRKVRMIVLKRDGARCACCGATPADGVKVHVDHIKPRKHFPELALDLANLQVLCEICNHGKGNWDQTDWRNNAVVDLQEWQRSHLTLTKQERR
jgi:5-methylcytosine-specific restriction endonuclease McrA